MARIVILGAGVAGHAAVREFGKSIGAEHKVIVVTPNEKWNWIPSNIWVGVGEMTAEQVTFDLAPVYEKLGVEYCQAKCTAIHPEGGAAGDTPYVSVEYTGTNNSGETGTVEYDYLINCTGPKLNFGATEGLGPEGFSASVCTAQHATEANIWLQETISAMKNGEKKSFVVGTGHGMCTCQGAAFEYIYNIDHTLRKAGVRDKATLTWISNEYELGDFGMGGVHISRGGYVTNGKVFAESLMVERDIQWITRAHVNKVEKNTIHYENLDGEFGKLEFDFSMLIPPFAGVGLKAIDKAGEDITEKLFAPNNFLKVDADYTPRPFEEWSAADWPKHYQNPLYNNIFAAGIAFAPPHPISKPMKSPNGTPISPTPPRTGMPSANIGKAVAMSIMDMINGAENPTHTASMAEIGAACVASTGKGLFTGTAATMTVFPIVPDFEKYPEYGRDMSLTFGEVGLAGHWMKHALHYMFLHQAQIKPGWKLIPD
ncbi:MAG: FAD-dependent oxidoreductase [Granulosicoccus sp.]